MGNVSASRTPCCIPKPLQFSSNKDKDDTTPSEHELSILGGPNGPTIDSSIHISMPINYQVPSRSNSHGPTDIEVALDVKTTIDRQRSTDLQLPPVNASISCVPHNIEGFETGSDLPKNPLSTTNNKHRSTHITMTQHFHLAINHEIAICRDLPFNINSFS
jgi:hypothetical protein